jgi:thymidylate synthase
MTLFDDVDSMWRSILLQLVAQANGITSRDGDVAGEIIGYQGWLDASKQRTFLANVERRLDPSYAAAEVLWYMSGGDKVKVMSYYAPSYEKFGDGEGRAHGAYGPRMMRRYNQNSRSLIEYAIDMLTTTPDTRQAVILIWTPDDLVTAWCKGSNDIPCTVSLKFYVRDKKLHMITDMRSNDVWLGFPYDVFAFTCIQRVVAAHVGVDVGPYCHQAGSMHLYARHEDRVRRALFEASTSLPHDWRFSDDTISSMQDAARCEEQLRLHGSCRLNCLGTLGCMARDLVAACALKSVKPPREFMIPHSVALRGLGRVEQRKEDDVPSD